ncbi:MAG: GNAT family N-acetyltransferase [Acidimicrobiales bacterium]
MSGAACPGRSRPPRRGLAPPTLASGRRSGARGSLVRSRHRGGLDAAGRPVGRRRPSGGSEAGRSVGPWGSRWIWWSPTRTTSSSARWDSPDWTRRRLAATVGWWVAASSRRRGVATAAVTAVREWALGPGGLRGLFAEIAVTNGPSIRVAEQAGFVPAETARNPQGPARGSRGASAYVAISTVK